ncbi:MAG TPA: hypothetical protein VJ783_27475 [Pirellulales bacterium]|nr:hypothetical protein [Pirellulales bacterium]
MRRRLWQYRPRDLTVLLLAAIALLLVLANLSFDRGWSGEFGYKSYGWPFVWHRYVTVNWKTIGWYFSAARLAGNIAVWVAILVAGSLACESFLRRHRPRPRWSIRAMLGAVALAAALFGWLAAARDRGNLQDPLIAKYNHNRWPLVYHTFVCERRGPKWLELIGMDRFRREIVSAALRSVKKLHSADPNDVELLARLARLPGLRSLSIGVDHVTPEVAAALNQMRRLRWLRIDANSDRVECLPPIAGLARLEEMELNYLTIDRRSLDGLTNLRSLSLCGAPASDEEGIWDECLRAIGGLGQLEHLQLSEIVIDGRSLSRLAALKSLKTLKLEDVHLEDIHSGKSLLFFLPLLPSLEVLELRGNDVDDRDLRELVVLPRLKSLMLDATWVTDSGLGKLAAIESLEELAIRDDWSAHEGCVTPVGLKSLCSLKHLKRLHLDRDSGDEGKLQLDEQDELQVQEDDLEAFRDALRSLRRSHEGIVIDGQTTAAAAGPRSRLNALTVDDALVGPDATWAPVSDAPWMTQAERAAFERNGGWATFDGAGHRDNGGPTITISF